MEGGEPKDPNEEHERKISAGKDHPNMSQDELWGTKAVPLQDPPLPARNLKSGPSGSSS